LFNILLSLKDRKLITKGKHFLIPSNVCPIVPAVFLKAKVNFDFIDISMTSFCMDEGLLLERIKNDISINGVLFVKTFGIEFDATNIYRKIKNINDDIFIIDDCCLCPPNFEYAINNSIADAAIFSTGYSKYVDIGWGGFGFIKDKYEYINKQILFNKDHLIMLTKNMNESVLNNSHFHYKDNNWLGGEAFLYDNFDQYNEQVNNQLYKVKKHKKLINNIYSQNLNNNIQMNREFWNWRFSIFVEGKKRLLEKIFESGLFASSHYKEVNFMFGKSENQYNSNTKIIHSRIVNLFNDFRFSENDAYKIVDLINAHIEKRGLE